MKPVKNKKKLFMFHLWKNCSCF